MVETAMEQNANYINWTVIIKVRKDIKFHKY